MARTDADAPVAASFGIQLPPGWWELPLDEDHQDADITNALQARWPDIPEQLRQQLGEYLGQLSAQARASGVLLSGLGVMVDANQGLVAASVVVAVAPARLAPSDLQPQATALARRGFPGPSDPPPAECSILTLPQAGPAIRVRSPAGPNGLHVQYFTPLPGTGATTVMTFACPPVTGHEPHDDLVKLFDAIAATLCFIDAEGEPLLAPGGS